MTATTAWVPHGFEDVLMGRQGRRKGRELWFQCPIHPDLHASARWNPDKQTWYCDPCRIGGGFKDLATRLGVASTNGHDHPSSAITTYQYLDEDGHLLFEVQRKPGKNFPTRRPDGRGGWIWRLDDVDPQTRKTTFSTRRVLYRLPELLAADTSHVVLIPEGEKDVDRVRALGFVATCNPHGAGKWRNEYAEALRGRHVAILPDNDGPGRSHAGTISRSVFSVAASVRVVDLPGLPDKGDVSDWLNAGGTAEQLRELVRLAPLSTSASSVEAPKIAPEANRAVLVRLSDVQPEKVSWLWLSRIPLGKLSLIDGDPGLGKSNLTLDIAARVTAARAFPDGSRADLDGPYGVVLLGAEDGLGDTIRPRLEAAGADLTRIVALRGIQQDDSERSPTVADLDAIRQAVRAVDARLVVVDPLMAHLPDDASSHRDQEMRRVLTPLAMLAEELGVAIVVIRHLNKSGGGNALYRGGGSIGIVGAVRSSLMVARDPEDDTGRRRVLASVKCNLAPPPPALAYRLETAPNGAPYVEWEGQTTYTADGLLAAALETADERDEARGAVEYLRDVLTGGRQLSTNVIKDGKAAGYTERRLRAALKTLGGRSQKDGFGKDARWYWSLSEEDPPPHSWPILGILGSPTEHEKNANNGKEWGGDHHNGTVANATQRVCDRHCGRELLPGEGATCSPCLNGLPTPAERKS